MCEFCHVVGLVEFGGIDFVDGVCIDFLLGSIVTLYQYPPFRQIVHNPSPDESRVGIPKPDISLAGEVVLALYDAAQARGLIVVF